VQKAAIETYIPGQTVRCPANQTIVLVGGCFDILHYGHIQFLEQARAQGEYLVVALEPDVCILRKNRHPMHTQHERATSLLAIRYVDHVLMLPHLDGYEDYLQLMRDVSPQVLAVTEGDPQMANQQRQAAEVDARLAVVNQLLDHLSSSKIHEHGLH
jgi:FAD synthetase